MEEDEELFDDKREKKQLVKSSEKSAFGRIMNVFIFIVFFAWLGICLMDYYRTYKEEQPMFCIKEGTTKYDDGTVDWCLGAGYKIYHYNRENFTGIEYGPFWSEDRSSEESD